MTAVVGELAAELDGPESEPEDDAVFSILSDNGRHASLFTLTEWMHRVLAGRAADEILKDEGNVPDYGALFVPESFGWMFSKINVGRKDVGGRGERLTLPVRLEWSGGPMLLTKSTEVYWSTASMGHNQHGACQVTLDDCVYEETVDKDTFGIPTSAVVPVEPRHILLQRLQVVSEEGRQAYWEMLQTMEPRVKIMLRRAHVGVSRDICTFQAMPDRLLLDDTTLDAVMTDFILGTGDDRGKLCNIIEKILTPASMHRVDPLKYINRAISRDAAEAVRQKVGDPRIGRRIRDVSRELDVRDINSVVQAMRDLHPKDKVSHDRVIAALSVQPDPMSSRWSTSHADGSESEFADPDDHN